MLSAVRYGVLKCSSTISGLPTEEHHGVHGSISPPSFLLLADWTERDQHIAIFWPRPLKRLYLWPEFDLILLLYFLLFYWDSNQTVDVDTTLKTLFV